MKCIAQFAVLLFSVLFPGWEEEVLPCGFGRGSLPPILTAQAGQGKMIAAVLLILFRADQSRLGFRPFNVKSCESRYGSLWSGQFVGMQICARLGKPQRHSHPGFQMHVPSATQFSCSSYIGGVYVYPSEKNYIYIYIYTYTYV